MSDKEEDKIVVPTGEYSFRMPPTIKVKMPVAVEPIEEEIKMPKPPKSPPLSTKILGGLAFLWQGVGLALVFFILLLGATYVFFRPSFENVVVSVRNFLIPPPPPPDMTRYVIARQAVLAEYPGGDGERYALDQGYPVTYLGETHQLTDGRVWMRVQAQYGPAAQPTKVNGWMQADKLSE